MMRLRIGLIIALFAILMQLVALLSPLFLNAKNVRVCVKLADFSQHYHGHDHTHKIKQNNLHSSDCDFCLLYSKLDLPKPRLNIVIAVPIIQYLPAKITNYQKPFLSIKLFKLPLKQAPPILK